MGMRYALARGISAVATWGLKSVCRRPAGNMPGKLALYADPQVIAHAREKVAEGSIIVVGTNGKTTTTLMLADILEASGKAVICNKSGANLDSGIATALLQAKPSDWGVFECDEMWVARVLPYLQSTYVVLTNLFPDQEDRFGGIPHIQKSLIEALRKSPATTLVYNVDDPHCQWIAQNVANPTLAFGVDCSLRQAANEVGFAQDAMTAKDAASAQDVAAIQDVARSKVAMPAQDASPAVELCPSCGKPLRYGLRQYEQLGHYACGCAFARPVPTAQVTSAHVSEKGIDFDLALPNETKTYHYVASQTGAYMVYNLALLATVAHALRCQQSVIQNVISTFDPKNGRATWLDVQGHETFVNLAKNPAGFNQNIQLVLDATMPDTQAVVAFFVNNKEGDGFDTGWLDKVNFEALTQRPQLSVCIGGMCVEALDKRLRAAGISPVQACDVSAVLALTRDKQALCRVYLFANYTALPAVLAGARALAKGND